MTAQRFLRVFLTALGTVALVAGLLGVATGAGGTLGDDFAGVNVDSEFRFFAAFWAAYGAVALWVSPRAAVETAVVRGLALALFAAGLARTVSWIDVGRPDTLYLVLLALELAIPPLLVACQARIAPAEATR